MNDYIYNKYLSYFLVLQVVLTGVAASKPAWVEKYYALGWYPYMSSWMRRLTGWVPFSVGDILIIALLVMAIRAVYLIVITRFSPFREHLYRIFAFISVLYFVFHLMWGLNYYRKPLPERLGLHHRAYDSVQLMRITRTHITRLNDLHRRIISNDSLTVDYPYDFRTYSDTAMQVFSGLQFRGQDLSFHHPSVKKSMYSLIMSYMGFSGYLNPFTSEAQINYKIPEAEKPFVVAHEMSHQAGYADEGEANLLAYIACMQSGDLRFRYSAELVAVQVLFGEVFKSDFDEFENLNNELLPGVRSDYQLMRDFWDSYHSPVTPVMRKIYDWYLKANRKKSGIRSYSEFVSYLMDLK